jgi:ribulose kinase
MDCVLRIRMSGAAFMDEAAYNESGEERYDGGFELARLLREAADAVEETWPAAGDQVVLHDFNGNRVGSVDFEGE